MNALTVRDSHSIPHMDECIDSLGDAAICITFDCNSGYRQIKIAKEDRDKTASTPYSGSFRLIWMSFVLKNAPAKFQRAVDII